MYFFFYGANQETGRKILKEMMAKFPEIEGEYKGLKVLAWTSGVDYILITRKPVRKIEDLKGMRIKVTADFAEAFKELGAEGVNAPMPESYMMMQKGLMDGVMGSLEALKSVRLAEVGKYCTMTNLYRTHGGSRAMNMEGLKKLPPDIRKILEDNIEWWGLENDKEFEVAHKVGEDFGRQNGVEYITPSKEEMAKFYAPLKGMAIKAAKDLDSKGIPGTKIFEEAQRLVQKYNK